MGIYSKYAEILWENGYYTVPCEGKSADPAGAGWNICDPDEDKQDKKIRRFIRNYTGEFNVGLLLSPVTGICAVDYDITDPDLLDVVLKVLPRSPIEKTGMKALTAFYKYLDRKTKISTPFFTNPKTGETNRIELLINKKQTILPPSIHPDTKQPYRYLTTCTFENTPKSDLDLYQITNADIDELYKTFEEECLRRGFISNKEAKAQGKGSGRNFTLGETACAMFRRGESFEKVVSELLKVDSQIHANHKSGELFLDKSEKINGDTRDQRARSFAFNFLNYVSRTDGVDYANKKVAIEAAAKSKGKGKDKGPPKKSTEYIDFKIFFDEYLEGAIREKITDEFMIKDDGQWQPVLSKLKSYRSLAHECGLSRMFVEDHLSYYQNTLEKKLLINFEEWDGEERMIKLFARLKFREDKLSPESCWDLFKGWCSNIFNRIEDPLNQNQILVFRGDQGIGKDTFINKIFGACFKDYFVNIEPSENNKENFMMVYGKLVANISEFDQTNKMNIASIKNLITTNKQRFRMPYERAAKDYTFHTSFISSSNFDSILRDPSGNRRYIIFDVEGIEFDYDHLIHPAQLLAEMKHWHTSGFKPSDKSTQELKKLIEIETPDDVQELALEVIKDIIARKERMKPSVVTYGDIAEELTKAARNLGVTVFRLQNLIKRHGLQKKSGSLRHYISEPEKH